MDNEKGLSIELKQDVAKGSYSNLAIITHSHSEFIIDFATMTRRRTGRSLSARVLRPHSLWVDSVQGTTTPSPDTRSLFNHYTPIYG